MMVGKKRTRPRHLGIVGKPTADIGRLRPVANVPAHLRTDFKPEDADIRTLVKNVLDGRKRLSEIQEYVYLLIKEEKLPEEHAKVILDIIKREAE